MKLNKILEGITPVGMNEGDKVVIEVVHGTPVIHFEPAKNENFLDDMVEDEYDEEDEDYDDEEEDEDCNDNEYEKDIQAASMLQKLLEDLKDVLKS